MLSSLLPTLHGGRYGDEEQCGARPARPRRLPADQLRVSLRGVRARDLKGMASTTSGGPSARRHEGGRALLYGVAFAPSASAATGPAAASAPAAAPAAG